MDDDGPFTYSPSSRSRRSITLLSTPSSLANSCTRIFATVFPRTSRDSLSIMGDQWLADVLAVPVLADEGSYVSAGRAVCRVGICCVTH